MQSAHELGVTDVKTFCYKFIAANYDEFIMLEEVQSTQRVVCPILKVCVGLPRELLVDLARIPAKSVPSFHDDSIFLNSPLALVPSTLSEDMLQLVTLAAWNTTEWIPITLT